jgi:hypothetical protein
LHHIYFLLQSSTALPKMGHFRLGTLPDTVPWRRLVALLAEDGDVAAIASATTVAAVAGLNEAQNDQGLAHSFLLLTEVVLAARQDNFPAALRQAGLDVGPNPGVFDVLGAFSDAVDRHLQHSARRTDIGEMAQLAALESLNALIGERSPNLFDATTEDIGRATYQLSTQRGFATLAHDFFARFTKRFLTYHLDRELPNHVGGNGRFADPQEHADFLAQLDIHCRQAAVIVQQYAGEWYSKHNFMGGITPLKARRFANHSLAKLRRELAARGTRDG